MLISKRKINQDELSNGDKLNANWESLIRSNIFLTHLANELRNQYYNLKCKNNLGF